MGVNVTSSTETSSYGGNGSKGGANGLGYNNAQYATGILGNVTPPASYASTAAGTYAAATGRHTDGSNFLLADGHAKWMRGVAVAAGSNNTTAGDPGTVSATAPVAANTGNATFAATFSYN